MTESEKLFPETFIINRCILINIQNTYLEGNTPMTFTLTRNESGKYENLDGFCLNEIVGNGKILYKNPFPLKRLSDEDIAIATCLKKMADFVFTKKNFYSVKDGMTDAKTALLF